MAVELGQLVAGVKEHITLDALSGKLIAIDAYNTIYQFLSIIRQPDGTPLKDSKGNVTSHLSGLFYRTISFVEHGITPVYVFDGMPPALKMHTIEARMNRRKEALEEWSKALKKGMLEEAREHAMASTTINKEIVASAKELLDYMGIAWLQAPGEGEAQAAKLTNEGIAYASASQDYDLLLFGSKMIVRNLAITGRRKLPKKNIYINVEPERVELSKFLKAYGITQRQLIWLGMLVGTDFNEGIEHIGPKTALKIVKQTKSLEDIEKYLRDRHLEFEEDPKEVERVFAEPDVKEVSTSELHKIISEKIPNKELIVKFMCDDHGFAQERIEKFADELISVRGKAGQKSIFDWSK
ncbi:MAG: flap endonuclease-1 [Candidatus Micrarchaeaceae archaeon]